MFFCIWLFLLGLSIGVLLGLLYSFYLIGITYHLNEYFVVRNYKTHTIYQQLTQNAKKQTKALMKKHKLDFNALYLAIKKLDAINFWGAFKALKINNEYRTCTHDAIVNKLKKLEQKGRITLTYRYRKTRDLYDIGFIIGFNNYIKLRFFSKYKNEVKNIVFYDVLFKKLK